MLLFAVCGETPPPQVMWKSQVKLMYKNKQDYQKFMGNYSTIMGATTFLIIFFGSQIVKAFGMKVRRGDKLRGRETGATVSLPYPHHRPLSSSCWEFKPILPPPPLP